MPHFKKGEFHENVIEAARARADKVFSNPIGVQKQKDVDIFISLLCKHHISPKLLALTFRDILFPDPSDVYYKSETKDEKQEIGKILNKVSNSISMLSIFDRIYQFLYNPLQEKLSEQEEKVQKFYGDNLQLIRNLRISDCIEGLKGTGFSNSKTLFGNNLVMEAFLNHKEAEKQIKEIGQTMIHPNLPGIKIKNFPHLNNTVRVIVSIPKYLLPEQNQEKNSKNVRDIS